MTTEPSFALDVGGANLKAAHSDGSVRAAPYALWREPDRLADRARALTFGLPRYEALLLTMTAELCDCFATRADGVRHVLDSVEPLAPRGALHVWGTDGRFHRPEAIRRSPALAAAANWLALATVAARLADPGPSLLIDVGSTTTDLIPIQDGRPVPAGRNDTERLRSGELVYCGVRRTPVCSLAAELPWRGRPTGLCAELFATTLDVYLTRGDLVESPDDRHTADGRPATRDAARDRLARMVGADREGFTEADAAQLADAADAVLFRRLLAAAGRALAPYGRPASVVIAGSGEFLARRIAATLVRPGGRVISMAERWGGLGSTAACARALLELAAESAP